MGKDLYLKNASRNHFDHDSHSEGFGKPPVDVISSSNIDIGAQRAETYRLLAELRSLGIASWPPPAVDAGAQELKEAISKNPGLLSFINGHLNYAIITTLRSLTGVKGHLDKALVILTTIRRALERFQEENKNKKKKEKKISTKKYSKVIDKLKESRAVGKPFVGLNTEELRSACERLRSLLAALNRGGHELNKRQRSVRKWKKAWDIIYVAGTLAVLACSGILAAVASPAAAIAGITASATAMKAVKPWINSLWDGWEGSLREEKVIIEAMQRRSGLVVRELENVCSLLEKLKITMHAVLKDVDFAINGEDMEVKTGIENIMAKKGELELGIDCLKERLDSLGGEIGKATTELLETIT